MTVDRTEPVADQPLVLAVGGSARSVQPLVVQIVRDLPRDLVAEHHQDGGRNVSFQCADLSSRWPGRVVEVDDTACRPDKSLCEVDKAVEVRA
jgi:hypothetical protein